MAEFGRFYLDKEKDISVTLWMEGQRLSYELATPNHHSGNLIANLASVCALPLCFNENGLYVIRGLVPCYYDGEGHRVFILRLGNTKVANVYPDGRIERKAYVPAIAKTLMSQTKDYKLDINKTLVKTYIREEIKFHTDLHSHRSANLSPDTLIALGIAHQLRYPYYYIKKLGLRLTDEQRSALESQRADVARSLMDCGLEGKYLERRIDDNTEINFAELIFNGGKHAQYNLPQIRASLAVMKDGQAVFTDLEKVYLYRYVFTKGKPSAHQLKSIDPARVPDADIRDILSRMLSDRQNPAYQNNTLYQDKLLWTARSYAKCGVNYAEISDTALLKDAEAPQTLREIHEIMPAVTAETGVVLRFLAAFRRIPLTLGRNRLSADNFAENLRVLRAIAADPYVAGCDFVGEEINDIRELRPVIAEVLKIAAEHPSFVLRIHGGENDSLPDNVGNSVRLIEESLAEGQSFPHVRIGHGLYTANLNSTKGKELLALLVKRKVVLEFQITSNVRLNNLARFDHHPLKQYLNAGVLCVQGTDGGALYGTDSVDEELSLERFLELDYNDIMKMRLAEDGILKRSLKEFAEKKRAFKAPEDVETYYKEKIAETETPALSLEAALSDATTLLADRIRELPERGTPIIIAGGSFNSMHRHTRMDEGTCRALDALMEKANPKKCFFVLGPSLSAYEEYVAKRAAGRFKVFAYAPAEISKAQGAKLLEADVGIRVAPEPAVLGVYKSIAYELLKRRPSVLLVLDGNSAAANLIQDAKNSGTGNRIFIGNGGKLLKTKAETLKGYVTMLDDAGLTELLRCVK